MIIKKMSDTQIMLLLTKQDMSERNINISDIATNSLKAQRLFRDIMSVAMTEYDFDSDESPIMIEAIPTTDGLTIIISKVKTDINDNISLVPEALDLRKFLNSPMTLKSDKSEKNNVENNIIFAFETLDDVTNVSARLFKIYDGINSLYKYKGKYYLMMELTEKSNSVFGDAELILSEYGEKCNFPPNELTRYMFMEHGELIVKDSAVQVLSKL